jgi:hypothetical protein
MVDLLSQTWQEITSRPDGPLAMRFYLQPLMATLLAARDGVKDAREGNSAYLWAVVYNPAHRRDLLRNGWRSIGKVFVIALVLDVVYQLLVLRGLRPLQGLIVAVALAIIPYALLRGPISRLARLARGGGAPKGKPA